jgi:rhodanese-related sulfurtransferase
MTHSSNLPKTKFPVWGWFILAVVVIATAVFFYSATRSTADLVMAKEISPQQAAQYQKAGAFLLDVREPEEWKAGHISGAVLIPLGDLTARMNEIPRDKNVVVVCRSGNRSAQGRDKLLNSGYSTVTSMAGGMNQWTAAGLPVVSGP